MNYFTRFVSFIKSVWHNQNLIHGYSQVDKKETLTSDLVALCPTSGERMVIESVISSTHPFPFVRQNS